MDAQQGGQSGQLPAQSQSMAQQSQGGYQGQSQGNFQGQSQGGQQGGQQNAPQGNAQTQQPQGGAQPQGGEQEPQAKQGIGSKIANAAAGAAKKAIGNAPDAVSAAVDAAKYGKGQGAAGMSLAKPNAKKGNGSVDQNQHIMYDKSGRPYKYTRKGNKWYDQNGGEVSPAFAATIEAQIAQKQQTATNQTNAAAKAPTAQSFADKRGAAAQQAQAGMTQTTGKATAKQRDPNEPNRFINKSPQDYTAYTTGMRKTKPSLLVDPSNPEMIDHGPMGTYNKKGPQEPAMEPEVQANPKQPKRAGAAAMNQMAQGLQKGNQQPTGAGANAMGQMSQQLQQPQTAAGWTGRTGQTQAQPAAKPNFAGPGGYQQANYAAPNVKYNLPAQQAAPAKQQAAPAKQAQPQTEGRDFGAMIWKQIK
jgi:hypothetical protein